MKGKSSTVVSVLVVYAINLTMSLLAFGDDNPYAPQPQNELKPMLSIEWKRGPNLPQGFQDSDGGVVGKTLVTACGFCQGSDMWANRKEIDALKPGRHPRGFLKKVWGLDLDHSSSGWTDLPDFPGTARQENFAIVVDEQLYCWGGFSYTGPFCYNDGYRLSKRDGVWTWDPLPSLPSPVGSSGICAIGSTIYVCGGADYDEQHFYTATDRVGTNKRLGARLLAIDTKNLAAGWQSLPQCPGTPRWVAAMAAVRGRAYLIGGATGDIQRDGPVGDVAEGNKSGGAGYCSVADNWMFDPSANRWTRLRDLPISSGNFPGGAIVYRDRYILLVGGAQYEKIANPDGTLRDKYGIPSRFDGNMFCNGVLVYDTETGLFGTADHLPLNNCLPMTVVEGDKAYLIGGEIGGAVVEGERYAHHPDLLLVGTIREL